MPGPIEDAQGHVIQAASNLRSAVMLLRGARDELVRALVLLGRLRSARAQRSALLPLTVLAVVSSAFDTLAVLTGRLDTLSRATPEKIEGEWREVIEAIFGKD